MNGGSGSPDSDDPKKPLRCPNGCGLPVDFTFGLRKCERCGKLLCQNCVRTYKNRKFCKNCHKQHSAEENRKALEEHKRKEKS